MAERLQWSFMRVSLAIVVFGVLYRIVGAPWWVAFPLAVLVWGVGVAITEKVIREGRS